MLTNNDIQWLAKTYPTLIPNIDRTHIEGVLDFAGAYNKKENRFTLVGSDYVDNLSSIYLSGSYKISIKKNNDTNRLPKLHLRDVAFLYTADRHFYPADESACVCGVLEESIFMSKGFDFKTYLEEMAIPFMYGQLYYDKYKKWPWRDYAHDTPGILESYFFHGKVELIPVTLERLRAISKHWQKTKSILRYKSIPKGGLTCFCSKHDQIKKCHPDALNGLKKLYTDLKLNNISIEN